MSLIPTSDIDLLRDFVAKFKPGNKGPAITLDALQQVCESGTPEQNARLKTIFLSLRELLRDYVISVRRIDELVEQGRTVENKNLAEDIDEIRGNKHTALEDTMNSLARELTVQGKNTAWLLENGTGRAAYAKFALKVMYEFYRAHPEQLEHYQPDAWKNERKEFSTLRRATRPQPRPEAERGTLANQ